MSLFVKALRQHAGRGFEVAGHFAQHASGGRRAAAQEVGDGLFGPIVFAGECVQAYAVLGAQTRNEANQAADCHGLLDAEEAALCRREIEPGASLAPSAQVGADLSGISAHLRDGVRERGFARKADALPGRGLGVFAEKAQMPSPFVFAVGGQQAHGEILVEAA